MAVSDVQCVVMAFGVQYKTHRQTAGTWRSQRFSAAFICSPTSCWLLPATDILTPNLCWHVLLVLRGSNGPAYDR